MTQTILQVQWREKTDSLKEQLNTIGKIPYYIMYYPGHAVYILYTINYDVPQSRKVARYSRTPLTVLGTGRKIVAVLEGSQITAGGGGGWTV